MTKHLDTMTKYIAPLTRIEDMALCLMQADLITKSGERAGKAAAKAVEYAAAAYGLDLLPIAKLAHDLTECRFAAFDFSFGFGFAGNSSHFDNR